jgi:hypothetical protein
MLSRNLLALPIALLAASPAVAGISKSVAVEDALGGRVPIVVAVEGGGVNIDFSETGETVQKVTLDDTSKVLVDFDKSLPIVRLFRGNVASKDVPSAKTTQLSITTKGADGDFRLYIFPVTTSSKPAIFTKFLIGGVTRQKGSSSIATAAMGAKVAQQNKTLVDPQLRARVAHYVQLRSGGMSDRKAAKRARISIALARRLDELGQSAPAPVAVLPVPMNPSGAVVKPIESSKVAVVPPPPIPVPEVQPQADTKRKHRRPEDEPATVEDAVVKPAQTIPTPDKPSPAFGTATPVEAGDLLNTQTPQKGIAQPSSSKGKSVVSIHRPNMPTIAKGKLVNRQDYANALLRGLNKARLDGKIRYGSNRWYAVNGAVRLLRRGGSVERAIAASGMKRDGFMKLLSDGGIEA